MLTTLLLAILCATPPLATLVVLCRMVTVDVRNRRASRALQRRIRWYRAVQAPVVYADLRVTESMVLVSGHSRAYARTMADRGTL